MGLRLAAWPTHEDCRNAGRQCRCHHDGVATPSTHRLHHTSKQERRANGAHRASRSPARLGSADRRPQGGGPRRGAERAWYGRAALAWWSEWRCSRNRHALLKSQLAFQECAISWRAYLRARGRAASFLGAGGAAFLSCGRRLMTTPCRDTRARQDRAVRHASSAGSRRSRSTLRRAGPASQPRHAQRYAALRPGPYLPAPAPRARAPATAPTCTPWGGGARARPGRGAHAGAGRGAHARAGRGAHAGGRARACQAVVLHVVDVLQQQDGDRRLRDAQHGRRRAPQRAHCRQQARRRSDPGQHAARVRRGAIGRCSSLDA